MRYSSIALISMGGQLTSLGLAFLFHFLIARWLGVELYGEFGVLLGAFTLLLFPVTSVQAVLMRETARLHAQNKEGEVAGIVSRYFMQALLAGGAGAALVLLVLFAMGLLIHPLEALVMLVSFPFFFAIFVFNSYFQGKQQPLHFVAVQVLADFLRLAFAALFVGGGLRLLGVGSSYLAAGLLLFLPIFFFYYLPLRRSAQPSAFSLQTPLRWVFPTYMLLALFLVVDVFFVRALAGSESAGLYNAALTLARAVFYAAIGAMNAFLPYSSRLDMQKEGGKILRPLALSIALLLAFAVLIFLFKDLLLGVLYGEAYVAAAPYLGILVFSILFLASSLLLVNLMWSQGEQKLPLLCAAIAAVVGLVSFYFFTSSMGAIGAAYASLISTALLLLLMTGGCGWLYLRNRSTGG